MSYANRGMQLEAILEKTCKQYEHRNLALINKVPTPVKVLSNKRGKITGFYEKKSTVDYEGILKGGRLVAFEAKQTKGKSLPLENIQKHQINYLKNVSSMGGISFLIVNFSELGVYYRLDIKDLLRYMQTPYQTNKKSIPIIFFENYAKTIKGENGLYLNFLKDL